METLITIKSIDIEEVKINKEKPTTLRRTQVSKDIVSKFIEFNGERKASIKKEDLKKVKPELDIDNLAQYEENLSLEQIFNKLGKSNSILVNKYGYKNLDVPSETLEKAINDSLEQPIKIIEEQQEEIEKLKKENRELKAKNNKNSIELPIYNLNEEDIKDLFSDEIEEEL